MSINGSAVWRNAVVGIVAVTGGFLGSVLHDLTIRQAAGSHEIWFNAGTKRYTTVPNHTGDMPEGTLRAILKQAGIDIAVYRPRYSGRAWTPPSYRDHCSRALGQQNILHLSRSRPHRVIESGEIRRRR